MSLISEALKKARLEARKEDGRLPYHTRPAPPRRRSSPWPWVAAVSIGLAVGVVVGAALLGRDPAPVGPAAGPETGRSKGSAPLSSPVEPSGGEAGSSRPRPAERPPSDPDPPPSSATEPTPAQNPSAPAPRSNDLRPASGTPSEHSPTAATPAPAPQPVEPSDAPTARSPGAPPGPRHGESYLQRVSLPGGGEIALRGIAWHATEPSALLNDRVLVVGDALDDWILVAVEPGRVEIERDGVRFYLRLK